MVCKLNDTIFEIVSDNFNAIFLVHVMRSIRPACLFGYPN